MTYGVNEAPFRYAHITASGATVIKATPGVLNAITVNNPGTTNTITVTDAAGTIAIIVAGTIPASYFYELGFTSLTVNPSATCDLTISFS